MDGSVPSLPIMKQSASLMETGPNGANLAAAAQARHPVDDLQRRLASSSSSAQYSTDLNFVRHVYGSGLTMRLATERKWAAQEGRAPGLTSSGLYRDIVTGQDTTLDFADFLSLPHERPDMMKETAHAALERQLGM